MNSVMMLNIGYGLIGIGVVVFILFTIIRICLSFYSKKVHNREVSQLKSELQQLSTSLLKSTDTNQVELDPIDQTQQLPTGEETELLYREKNNSNDETELFKQ